MDLKAITQVWRGRRLLGPLSEHPQTALTSRPRPGDSHSSSHATHHTGAQTAAPGAGGLSLQPGNREVQRRGTLSPPSDTLCPPRPPWCGTSPRAGLGPRRDGRGMRRGQGRTGDNGCAPPAYADGATNGTRSGASALTGCAGGEPAGTSRWVKAVAGADPVSGACSLEMGTPVSRGVASPGPSATLTGTSACGAQVLRAALSSPGLQVNEPVSMTAALGVRALREADRCISG